MSPDPRKTSAIANMEKPHEQGRFKAIFRDGDLPGEVYPQAVNYISTSQNALGAEQRMDVAT